MRKNVKEILIQYCQLKMQTHTVPQPSMPRHCSML